MQITISIFEFLIIYVKRSQNKKGQKTVQLEIFLALLILWRL